MKIRIILLIILSTLTKTTEVNAPEMSIEDIIDGSLNLDNTNQEGDLSQTNLSKSIKGKRNQEFDVTSKSIGNELSEVFSKIIASTPVKQTNVTPSEDELNTLESEDRNEKKSEVSQGNQSQTVDLSGEQLDEDVSNIVEKTDDSDATKSHHTSVVSEDEKSVQTNANELADLEQKSGSQVSKGDKSHQTGELSEATDLEASIVSKDSSHKSGLEASVVSVKSEKTEGGSSETEKSELSKLEDQKTEIDNLESLPVDQDEEDMKKSGNMQNELDAINASLDAAEKEHQKISIDSDPNQSGEMQDELDAMNASLMEAEDKFKKESSEGKSEKTQTIVDEKGEVREEDNMNIDPDRKSVIDHHEPDHISKNSEEKDLEAKTSEKSGKIDKGEEDLKSGDSEKVGAKDEIKEKIEENLSGDGDQDKSIFVGENEKKNKLEKDQTIVDEEGDQREKGIGRTVVGIVLWLVTMLVVV